MSRPSVLTNIVNRLANKLFASGKSASGQAIEFTGDYSSWDAAQAASTGYSAPAILDKALQAILKVKSGEAAYERDTIIFDTIQYSFPLLSALLLAGSREGRLSVLDFGGALGSSYFQNRAWLTQFREFRWGVVEQGHFVACGRERVSDAHLSFHENVEQCSGAIEPNFALLSGVLSYVPQPEWVLDEVLRPGMPFIFIDRTLVSMEGGTRLTIQTVPPSIYEARYPCWIFDEGKLLGHFRDSYRLLYAFDAVDGADVRLDGLRGAFKGYFFVRPDVAALLGVW